MAAVAGDKIIAIFVEKCGCADGDGLLTAVEMAKPTDAKDFSAVSVVDAGLGIFGIGSFFETTNEHHHA